MPWLGLGIGAANGALGGALSDYSVDDKFIKEVGAKVEPGHSALFLLMESRTEDKVMDEIKGFNAEVLQTSLSKEDEAKLKAASMAVTAHELGYIQQYQPGSGLIKARGFLLPALQFSPTISYIAILMGLWWNMTGMLWVGIFFFALLALLLCYSDEREVDLTQHVWSVSGHWSEGCASR
jgi:hypothetical protein